jgi:hypothetical protein
VSIQISSGVYRHGQQAAPPLVEKGLVLIGKISQTIGSSISASLIPSLEALKNSHPDAPSVVPMGLIRLASISLSKDL